MKAKREQILHDIERAEDMGNLEKAAQLKYVTLVELEKTGKRKRR